ncbi:transposase [Paludibaculum fermentans]|uniref:Transposase n=1 Tax=Paludibaculum fermentans TaxID=1473598 RepID=A0A7S7NVG9_PALFE|nr:transposase [Paludibaculum fermentans]QOY90572.1 transposase [Paludibaculum fermentans]
MRWRQRQAKSRPFLLEKPHRELILETIRKTSAATNYELLAAHIRTTHLHIILDTPSTPEQSMGDLKLACTMALKAANLADAEDRIWADYGHIRPLRSPYALTQAINYILNGQGAPMDIYRDEPLTPPTQYNC